jgi:hypothetical protein
VSIFSKFLLKDINKILWSIPLLPMVLYNHTQQRSRAKRGFFVGCDGYMVTVLANAILGSDRNSDHV